MSSSDSDLQVGLYETVVTEELSSRLQQLDPEYKKLLHLDSTSAAIALRCHLSKVLSRALSGPPERQAELINRLLEVLSKHTRREHTEGEQIIQPPRELLAVLAPPQLGQVKAPNRPRTRLSESALLTNASGDESIGPALKAEFASADEVDLLCAFIQWYGVRVLADELTAFCARGGRLRVITSTYMGATQRNALDWLESLGAQIRVGYESKTTRLHAKAWLFRRATGFCTAYIGSSNMSRSALVDGLEWNVRLSRRESPHLLEKFEATFESYWNGVWFEPYEQTHDAERFDRAVQTQRIPTSDTAIAHLDVRPYPYQREMLERLTAEREVHQRWRNLVVAATGTGKTVVAALDYKQLVQRHGELRLLFVAHRKEILSQSQATFRQVLRDGSFGERLVAGDRPEDWNHVFASIQGLSRISDLPQNHFDVVIIDEFHHAAAPTYRRLMDRIRPRILLGLTATPERTDGLDVLNWFDGRPAVELRLWDALDQQLLCPFQYFGVSDNTDLRGLDWRSGRYDERQLEELYTGDDARVRLILAALRKQVPNASEMRAIGFCVSQKHARFMAARFTAAGIPSAAVLGTTPQDIRDAALRKLSRRELNVLFAVDIYNEGVDAPEVDTLLMLRPTQSATVFLQQLGRGLRLSEDKPCCTILDFIGLQHRRFRFDLKYRALTSTTRRTLQQGIENGFPRLPAGCHIHFDRQSQSWVLDNIKKAIPRGARGLGNELRRLGRETTLRQFIDEVGLELEDLYRSKNSFTQLMRQAGFLTTPSVDDSKLLARLQTLLHVDDRERIEVWSRWLAADEPPEPNVLNERQRRLLEMLHFGLRGHDKRWSSLQESIRDVWKHQAVRSELCQLLTLLQERAETVPKRLPILRKIPLQSHVRYTRDEILVGVGDLSVQRQWKHQTGVHWSAENQLDVLFVTLNKTATHFSPSTSYRDYPISQELFHWESQSVTRPESPTGRRYLRQHKDGTHVLLCVREVGKDNRGVSVPFFCLGLVDYVSHRGSRPIAITWRLKRAMPAVVFERGKAVAG